MMTSMLVVTLMVLLNAGSIQAQYFAQNFDSSNVLTYYVNATTPSTAQFNYIGTTTGTAASINSQKLRFVRSNNGAGAASRTTNFIGSPTVLMVKFDLTVSGSHSSGTDLGRIAIGNTFTSSTTLESTSNGSGGLTYAYLHLEARGSNAYRLQTADDNSSDQSSGSTSVVTWVLNKSGSTVSYPNPSGGTSILSNNVVDFWIGTSIFSSAIAVTRSRVNCEYF